MLSLPRVNQIVSRMSHVLACDIIEVKIDVERTMQFILGQQAKSEARWQRAEERMDNFDRGLNAIAKLVQTGMKMLNKVAEEQREIRANMKQTQASIQGLAAAQKRTDQKFERLVELLSRRSPNGRR